MDMKRDMLIFFLHIHVGGYKGNYFKNCLWNDPWMTIPRIPKNNNVEQILYL